MRGDIVNFSQTCFQIMATAKNSFSGESCSQAGIATLDNSRSNTTNYRYESEIGQGTINDHVKTATVVNNLKGSIAQNLMMKINQRTTFDEYFNSTYTGRDEDNRGTSGRVNNYEDENYNDKNYDKEYDENWEYDNDDKITIAYMKG
eukprot:4625128-Amphidinium_carterae.2